MPGFFHRRREPGLPPSLAEQPSGLRNYANLPDVIGCLISAGKATLHELETVYSLEDAFLMMEVLVVDHHNRKCWGPFNDRA